VIINVGVGGIVLDCLVEGFKRLGHIALLHVYARNLDPALGQRWYQLHRLFEISFGTISIGGKEPVSNGLWLWYDAGTRGKNRLESAPEVKRFRSPEFP
jgi:hypothetical protein